MAEASALRIVRFCRWRGSDKKRLRRKNGGEKGNRVLVLGWEGVGRLARKLGGKSNFAICFSSKSQFDSGDAGVRLGAICKSGTPWRGEVFWHHST